MTTRVTFQGSRNDLRMVMVRLARILIGREHDAQGVARGFLLAIGFGALSDIKTAFIAKSRGGTDEMGVHWPRLSRKYLAYGRRFGPGEKAELNKAGKVLLAKKKLVAKQQERKLFARFAQSLPVAEARRRAKLAAYAYVIKVTRLEKYGDRSVEILRDTGVLFNSLSPGVLTKVGPAATYHKPSGQGGSDQILDVAAGKVIVGTNVPYAAVHQYGSRTKNIPRRQFLPDSDGQIPDAWWERWFKIATRALELGLVQLLRAK